MKDNDGMTPEAKAMSKLVLMMLAPIMKEVRKRAEIVARRFYRLGIDADELVSEMLVHLAKSNLVLGLRELVDQQILCYCDTTMMNICRDQMKALDGEVERLGRYGAMLGEQYESDPSVMAMHRDSVANLKLMTTDSEWRLLKMHYLDGMSLAEMANEMNITPRAIEGRVYRVLAKIRKAIGAMKEE